MRSPPATALSHGTPHITNDTSDGDYEYGQGRGLIPGSGYVHSVGISSADTNLARVQREFARASY